MSLKSGSSCEHLSTIRTCIRLNICVNKFMHFKILTIDKKCSGVLCDKRMPVKLKGKVYRTVVRPAMLYGAETWATTKRQESRIEVNEMRILRWMCGVTRKYKNRNEHIRGTTKVVQASRKITERRLKWYGHVMRMEEDHVVRRAGVEESDDESDTGEKEERETKDKVEGCVQEGHADCRTERGR